ncbi:gibberellin-regulated protein 9 isoform X2 [Capsicum chacoense]
MRCPIALEYAYIKGLAPSHFTSILQQNMKIFTLFLIAILLIQIEADNEGALHKQIHPTKRIHCGYACARRCKKSSRKKVCTRACKTCCARCKCVPPGTYGNKEACPCYARLKTHGNRPKCP